jgi:cobalt-zinc-cadmium efflux system outer membrane protein
MKTKFNWLLVMGLMAFNLIKAQAPLLPLDTVLQRISRANPALLAYVAKASAQNEYAKGARNLDAPQISAGQYQVPYAINPNMGSFMVQASQNFTNRAKLTAKEKYMQGMSAVTEQEQAYLKNQLVAQARGYYYNMAVIEKKLALLQNTRMLFEYMLKDANIKLTYGKEKLENIYKAKADLYQLDNSSEQLSNETRQNLVMLNTLMYRDKQTAFRVDTNIIVKTYETGLTDTADLANKRSDIKMIDRNIQLQQLSAGVELSKRKPDFGIQAAHMFSYGGLPNQYILMGTVSIPIASWSSKEYKANLKGIRYEVEELQNEKLDKLNAAAGQLASIRLDIASKKRLLANYQQNIIPALQNSYKTALLAYEQNTGNLNTVLDAIKSVQLMRMEALNSLQELSQLQVAYEKENEGY